MDGEAAMGADVSEQADDEAAMGADVNYDFPNDGVRRIPFGRHLELQQQPPQEVVLLPMSERFWFLNDGYKEGYDTLLMDERSQMVSHIFNI